MINDKKMVNTANPYMESIERNLPRIFALFDTDRSSSSYGYGDRFYWSWGLIDFGNGSFQGIAHGFARLLEANLLPKWVSESAIIERIDAMFIGAKMLTRQDGSLEEAFPYEGSYCVTALVAFDLISCIDLLVNRLEPSTIVRYTDIVRPMVSYLLVADEHHAFISNHLATAVAALFKWEKITGEGTSERAQVILDRIISNQSHEGWYLEYDGADPGYQSLCCYYLSDALETTRDDRLKTSLIQSMEFLQYFVHPDGSYGGLYGSRNTRFYYPAGFEYLALDCNLVSQLTVFMRESVEQNLVVGLDSIDEPNLAPMFNCYCWAAELCNRKSNIPNDMSLPCLSKDEFQIHFKDAGLLIDRRSSNYTIVSLHKGGVLYHFNQGKLDNLDTGKFFLDDKKHGFTTQNYCHDNEYTIANGVVSVTSQIRPVPKRLFRPWQMIVLRVLNITVMRHYWLREFIKKVLVKILITRNGKKVGQNIRNITLGTDLHIEDTYKVVNESIELQKGVNQFVSIHMASKGYWQKQDTE